MCNCQNPAEKVSRHAYHETMDHTSIPQILWRKAVKIRVSRNHGPYILSDCFPNELIRRVIDALGPLVLPILHNQGYLPRSRLCQMIRLIIYSRRGCGRTSSMTSTRDRLRIARAMHSNCFSLCKNDVSCLPESKQEDLYPVEKFSPPSETEESRSRNTFALTAFSASAGVSSDGIK